MQEVFFRIIVSSLATLSLEATHGRRAFDLLYALNSKVMNGLIIHGAFVYFTVFFDTQRRKLPAMVKYLVSIFLPGRLFQLGNRRRHRKMLFFHRVFYFFESFCCKLNLLQLALVLGRQKI